jgi:hypothetical protein
MAEAGRGVRRRTDAPGALSYKRGVTESLPHIHALTRPLRPPAPDIACAEWDLLFRAVLYRLTILSSHPVAPARRLLELQTESDIQRECLAALEQLRRSAGTWSPAERPWLRS